MEQQPENLPIPDSEKRSWKEWYQDAVKERGREVRDTDLENEDWKVDKNPDGRVSRMRHKDGLFFTLVGKDAGFKQPFVEPVTDPEDPLGRQGIVVMFVDEDSGDMLLEAQFETGSKAPKGVSIRPTIQASYSNIRNNGYPFSNKFTANNIQEFATRFSSNGGIGRNELIDPGRIGNFNFYGILPINRQSINLSQNPYHRWVSQGELEEIRASQAVSASKNDAPLLTNQFSVVNEMRLNWLLSKK